MRTCDLPGCESKHHSKGMCEKHYRNQRRNGTPYALPRQVTPPIERFASHVIVTGCCWYWTARKTHEGYGHFIDDGITWIAHRWIYAYAVGPIPDGMHLDHLCRIRECVNPDHLQPVAPGENSRRSRIGWQGRTTCKNGHDITDAANVYTRPNGVRLCRPCQLQRQRDWYAENGRKAEAEGHARS